MQFRGSRQDRLTVENITWPLVTNYLAIIVPNTSVTTFLVRLAQEGISRSLSNKSALTPPLWSQNRVEVFYSNYQQGQPVDIMLNISIKKQSSWTSVEPLRPRLWSNYILHQLFPVLIHVWYVRGGAEVRLCISVILVLAAGASDFICFLFLH